MRSRLPVIPFVLSAVCVPPAFAGAWTQADGEGYWKFEQRVTRVDYFHGPDGSRVDIPALSDDTTSFYGEYGAGERATVFSYVPFVEHESLDAGPSSPRRTTVTDVADVDVGVRVGLWKRGRGVLSLQLTLGLPTGRSKPLRGLVTGDGEWNGIAALQAGRSFEKAPVYISGEVGFNERTRGFSDECRFSGEVGWRFVPRWSLTGRLRGVRSLHNGRPSAGSGTSGLYANDVEYLIFGPEISFAFRKDAWIAATAENANGVRNSIGGPTYAISVSWKSRARRRLPASPAVRRSARPAGRTSPAR